MNKESIIHRLVECGFNQTGKIGWAGDERLDPPGSWNSGRASVYIDHGVLRATGVSRLIPTLSNLAEPTAEGRNCMEWKGEQLARLLTAIESRHKVGLRRMP